MTRLFCLAILLTGASPSLAQVGTGGDPCIGEGPFLPEEFTGADPTGLPPADALALALDVRLDINDLEDVLGWAVLYAEPEHADVLKAIAERYRCDGAVATRAYLALLFLGEPSSYFVEAAAAQVAAGFPYASRSISVLEARADPAMIDDVARLREEARGTPAERELNFGTVDGMDPYAAEVRYATLFRTRPLAERAFDAAAVSLAVYLNGGVLLAETGEFFVTELADTYDPGHAFWLARYRELARTHPSATTEATARAVAAIESGEEIVNVGVRRPVGSPRPPDVSGPGKYLPSERAALAAVARDSATSLAPGLVDVPPVDLGADLRPGPVCVEDVGLGATVARFRYSLAAPDPVRVPPGPDNGLTGAEGAPPEAFYPDPDGQDPGWPILHHPGQTATWTLLGRHVGASDASPRCDGPDPLRLDALPAAVAVAGSASASFAGGAFHVSGAPHALDGTPVSGAAVPAVLTDSDGTADAVRAALSGNQLDRLYGAAAVAAGALFASPGSWAEALVRRATVTLDARPRGPVGSAAAPVVAHAPDGVRLDGGFEGWGVLVVDGPLDLRGSARWTGLVIVRGGASLAPQADLSGTPAVVGGLVLADGASLVIGGRAEILYSPEALGIARSAVTAD